MSSTTVEMKIKKSTKGTHVYEADSEVVPSIYIKKAALPATPPPSIKLTIEWVE